MGNTGGHWQTGQEYRLNGGGLEGDEENGERASVGGSTDTFMEM